MVEAEHHLAGLSRRAERANVIGRIDQIACCRPLGEIAGRNGALDPARLSDQQPTALGGRRVPRVGEDRGACLRRDLDDQTASTTIAIPMPPPMQSDATPRFAPRPFMA